MSWNFNAKKRTPKKRFSSSIGESEFEPKQKNRKKNKSLSEMKGLEYEILQEVNCKDSWFMCSSFVKDLITKKKTLNFTEQMSISKVRLLLNKLFERGSIRRKLFVGKWSGRKPFLYAPLSVEEDSDEELIDDSLVEDEEDEIDEETKLPVIGNLDDYILSGESDDEDRDAEKVITEFGRSSDIPENDVNSKLKNDEGDRGKFQKGEEVSMKKKKKRLKKKSWRKKKRRGNLTRTDRIRLIVVKVLKKRKSKWMNRKDLISNVIKKCRKKNIDKEFKRIVLFRDRINKILKSELHMIDSCHGKVEVKGVLQKREYRLIKNDYSSNENDTNPFESEQNEIYCNEEIESENVHNGFNQEDEQEKMRENVGIDLNGEDPEVVVDSSEEEEEEEEEEISKMVDSHFFLRLRVGPNKSPFVETIDPKRIKSVAAAKLKILQDVFVRKALDVNNEISIYNFVFSVDFEYEYKGKRKKVHDFETLKRSKEYKIFLSKKKLVKEDEWDVFGEEKFIRITLGNSGKKRTVNVLPFKDIVEFKLFLISNDVNGPAIDPNKVLNFHNFERVVIETKQGVNVEEMNEFIEFDNYVIRIK